MGGDHRVHGGGPRHAEGRGHLLRQVREERQRAAARRHADLRPQQAPQGQADVQGPRRARRQGGHDVHRPRLRRRRTRGGRRRLHGFPLSDLRTITLADD